MLPASQSPEQVLDLKDRPWDGKPYTINNLLRPLSLPWQGHVVARAAGRGNLTCQRASARPRTHRSCQNMHSTRARSGAGGSRPREESLPLHAWATARRNTALITCLSYGPRFVKRSSPTLGTVNGISLSTRLHETDVCHPPAAVRTTRSRAGCSKGPTSQRCPSTNSKLVSLES